jgi:hypothetical protein
VDVCGLGGCEACLEVGERDDWEGAACGSLMAGTLAGGFACVLSLLGVVLSLFGVMLSLFGVMLALFGVVLSLLGVFPLLLGFITRLFFMNMFSFIDTDGSELFLPPPIIAFPLVVFVGVSSLIALFSI